MQDVRQLAAKLFVGGGERLGHDIFSLEVRRWAPEAGARAGVATVAGADPTLMQMVQLAGLLGDEQTMAERTTEYLCSGARGAVGVAAGGRLAAASLSTCENCQWQCRGYSCTTRWPQSAACTAASTATATATCAAAYTAIATALPADALREVSEAERRERFSFALARTLDIGPQRLQQLLYSQVYIVEAGWGLGWGGA